MKRLLATGLALVLAATLIFLPARGTSAAELGTVRVRLQSAGSPYSVNVQVNGSYAIPTRPDILLQSGTTYNISNSGGSLTLTGAGLSAVSIGNSFMMKATANIGSRSNYLFISDAIQRSYLGDMNFTANGGGVSMVNHVFIEDYVIGVVRGELSNDFPLEALKAQALAARSYVYRQNFDIGDTTADQVYHGYRSSDTNVIRAVDETAGQILYSAGQLFYTYYSASNGGQTEHILNRFPDKPTGPHSVMRDDPYDLQNPSSMVESLIIYSNGASTNYQFDALLQQKLMAAGYYGTGFTVWDIQLSNPRNSAPGSEGSRYYLTMTVTVQTTEGQQYSVQFLTQNEMIDIVSRINRCSLFTVTRLGDGSFQLDARRYGHGVGMSQRGAQEMARQGYDYRSILSFYYQGVEVVQKEFQRDTSGAIDNPYNPYPPTNPTTPTNPSTPGNTVIGTGVVTASSLNIRAAASTSGAKVGSLARNATVSILADAGEFYAIQYNLGVAYASKQYITATMNNNPPVTNNPGGSYPTTPNATNTRISLPATMTAVEMRYNPITSSGVMGSLTHGTPVTVLTTTADGSWSMVEDAYTRQIGYVPSQYITSGSGAANNPTTPTSPGNINNPTNPGGSTPLSTVGTIKTAGGNATLRAQADINGTAVALLANGLQVSVKGQMGDWYYVTLTAAQGGYEGYVHKDYITVSSVPVVSNPGGGTPTAGTATIRLDSGSGTLHIRSGPGTTYASAGFVSHGAQVNVGGTSGEWTAISYNGVSGYVKSYYLSTSGASGGSGGGTITPGTATVRLTSATGSLNIRAGAGTTFAIKGTVGHGQTVGVGATSGEWTYISTSTGVVGYVKTSYLSTGAGSGSGAPIATATMTTTASVHLRQQATASSTSLGVLAPGTTVTVIAKGSEFTNVTVGSRTGYVSNKYLK